MQLARLIVYALAVFRVVHLLWAERGPIDAADWLRAKAGVYYRQQLTYQSAAPLDTAKVESVTLVREAEGFWGELMNCPLCLSGWVAIPAVVGCQLRSRVLDVIAVWLAMWGMAVLLFKVIGDDE